MATASTVLLLLPGLGSDHRLWHTQRSLPYKTVAPDYIDTLHNETLAEYAVRFLNYLFDEQAISKDDDLVIVGASMGGAIAQEMARHIRVRALVLTGSLRSNRELRWLIRLFGSRLAGRLPLWIYRYSIGIVPLVMKYLSAVHSDDIKLCTLMYHDLPKHFFRAGYRMLSHWPGCEVSVPLLRIHGMRDHIIPFKRVSGVDVVIADGKHLLCLSHAREVNQAINEFLSGTSMQPA